jgi:predicted Zn-dependent protease
VVLIFDYAPKLPEVRGLNLAINLACKQLQVSRETITFRITKAPIRAHTGERVRAFAIPEKKTIVFQLFDTTVYDSVNLQNVTNLVVIHELAHLLGLTHCKSKRCCMGVRTKLEQACPSWPDLVRSKNEDLPFCRRCLRQIAEIGKV